MARREQAEAGSDGTTDATDKLLSDLTDSDLSRPAGIEIVKSYVEASEYRALLTVEGLIYALVRHHRDHAQQLRKLADG